MSALALLARGENRFVKLADHDTVILSSHAIPGNESNVNRVIDGLLKAGAEVVHSGIADVHATGHAQADELKTYLSIAQPGVVRADPRRVPPPAWPTPARRADGRAARPRARVRGRRRARASTDDGRRAGRPGAGRLPLRRRHRRRRRPGRAARPPGAGRARASSSSSSRSTSQTGKVLVGPEIITRGWVYAPEAEDLLDEACDTIAAAVEEALAAGVRDVEALERDVRRAAGQVRQRAHPAAADDRARGDGGVRPASPRRRRRDVAARRRCWRVLVAALAGGGDDDDGRRGRCSTRSRPARGRRRGRAGRPAAVLRDQRHAAGRQPVRGRRTTATSRGRTSTSAASCGRPAPPSRRRRHVRRRA